MAKRYSYLEMREIGLTEAEIQVCRVMGMDPWEFIQTRLHCTDPRNINPDTGLVEWQEHKSMPEGSIEEAKAKARAIRDDDGQIIDDRPLDIY